MKSTHRVCLALLIGVFFLTFVAIPANADALITLGLGACCRPILDPIVWTVPFNLTNIPNLPDDAITSNLTINVLPGRITDSTARIAGAANSALQAAPEAAGAGELVYGPTDVFGDVFVDLIPVDLSLGLAELISQTSGQPYCSAGSSLPAASLCYQGNLGALTIVDPPTGYSPTTYMLPGTRDASPVPRPPTILDFVFVAPFILIGKLKYKTGARYVTNVLRVKSRKM